MPRAFNFCAGPAALPEEVLLKAKDELLDWKGLGVSVMEVSHRSKEFMETVDLAESSLRRLLEIPDSYAVLFLQGGASLQFSAIPINFGVNTVADYVHTGHWSEKSIKEAERFCDVKIVAEINSDDLLRIPAEDTWEYSKNPAYLHLTSNETISGVEFFWTPNCSIPIVADMSSTLLSRPIDVTKYGVIYAGAQKNIGPAGLTILIVRKDLLGNAIESCPSMLNWTVAAENSSMQNTPPTFAIYMAGLVFSWLEEIGGLDVMESINRRKASAIYEFIDKSDFYSNNVEVKNRSLMNVPFRLMNDRLDEKFLEESSSLGLLNLKGHRAIGGMRASIYNAVPEDAVNALISFMSDFEIRYG